jgi:mannose/fructose/N-acetylgalactosamine-specific phosphotransferase system component IIC
MSPILAASLVGGALAAENRSSVRFMLSQPLCGGTLTGLFLGAPADGMVIGALIQMMFLGLVSVRGERVPDLPLGGVTGAAVYILVNRELAGDPSTGGLVLFSSLLLAIAAAALGSLAYRFWGGWSLHLYETALRSIEAGRFGRASAVHLATVLVHFLFGWVIVAVVISGGRALVLLLAPRTALFAGGSLGLLYTLIPLIGAGSLVRLHFSVHRTFWFGAGFLVVYVLLLVRG